MKIILGSQSFGRKSVLEKAGYTFDVMPADIDEMAIRSDDYELLPLLLARAKADTLVKRISEPVILITSDQVVVYGGTLREKPETKEQAIEFLRSYSHHPAQTNTAVVVTNTQTGKRGEGIDIAKVYFNPIPDSVIDQLVEEGKVFRTAGGFMVEHPLLKPYVNRIEGSIDSITGLPLKLTERLINEVSNSS